MYSKKSVRTVEIGGNAFALSGERTAGGVLRFSVVDFDCALAAPDDEITLRFQDALKRRLAKLRERREAAQSAVRKGASD